MRKKLWHPTKKYPMYKEARKEAQVATRRCYGCIEIGHKVDRCPYKQNKHRASKTSIEQIKAVYAMLVEERCI